MYGRRDLPNGAGGQAGEDTHTDPHTIVALSWASTERTHTRAHRTQRINPRSRCSGRTHRPCTIPLPCFCGRGRRRKRKTTAFSQISDVITQRSAETHLMRSLVSPCQRRVGRAQCVICRDERDSQSVFQRSLCVLTPSVQSFPFTDLEATCCKH